MRGRAWRRFQREKAITHARWWLLWNRESPRSWRGTPHRGEDGQIWYRGRDDQPGGFYWFEWDEEEARKKATHWKRNNSSHRGGCCRDPRYIRPARGSRLYWETPSRSYRWRALSRRMRARRRDERDLRIDFVYHLSIEKEG